MPVGDQLFQLWHQLRTREEYVIEAGANFSGNTKSELLLEILRIKEARGLPIHRWQPVPKPVVPGGRPGSLPNGMVTMIGLVFGFLAWILFRP